MSWSGSYSMTAKYFTATDLLINKLRAHGLRRK